MQKEYFSHDYYARKDPKCQALIKEFGIQGYGFYWCLIEKMYEQGGKIEKFPALYSGLAFEFNIPEDELTKQIEAMLHRFNLLQENEKFIWSDSINDRLLIREEKRKIKSEAGRIGGIKSGESRRNGKHVEAKRSNPLKQTKQNEPNEAKRKERESKVNTIPIGINGTDVPVENDHELKKQFRELQLPASAKEAWQVVKEWIQANNPVFIEPYVAAWNIFASFYQFPAVKKITEPRRRKFRTRIREDGFNFFEILDKSKRSDFLKSGSWFCFDWVIENESNYVKILEENYK